MTPDAQLTERELTIILSELQELRAGMQDLTVALADTRDRVSNMEGRVAAYAVLFSLLVNVATRYLK